jgi:hypothetical protein
MTLTPSIVGEYQASMATDKLVGALDGNPFDNKFNGVAFAQQMLKAIADYL